MTKNRRRFYHNLFHLSPIPNLTVLTPRIPEAAYWGYEDKKQKRVCFSTSIKRCLIALSDCNGQYYVYIPVNQHKAYSPTPTEVVDVSETSEKWITRPVKVKCIGAIVPTTYTVQEVYFPIHDETLGIFTYGWKWIEKYN
jgi:hypothetical protein